MPVDVVGDPVSGDGRVPFGGAFAVVGAGAGEVGLGFKLPDCGTTTPRLRNAIL